MPFDRAVNFSTLSWMPSSFKQFRSAAFRKNLAKRFVSILIFALFAFFC